MATGKNKESSKKKVTKTETIVILEEIRKECRKHFRDIVNVYTCSQCKFEHICEMIQYNNYPRLWDTKKMVIK